MEYPVKDWMPLIMSGTKESERRFAVINSVYTHPTEIPTVKEIHYANPSISNSNIDSAIDDLINANILTKLSNGETYIFISLTDKGKQFIVDLGHYKGHNIMKGIYDHMEKTDVIEVAYNSERPVHKPVTKEYDEQELDDEWDEAYENAVRKIYLGYTLENPDTGHFIIEIRDGDTDNILDSDELYIPNYSKELTQKHRKLDFTEKRGDYDPNSYSITIKENDGFYEIRINKNDNYWYDLIKRDLCIFTENDR